MAVGRVFEEWLDGFLEVDAALGAFEEEGGVFIGQASEELSGISGFSKRSDSTAILPSNWSEELPGQVANSDDVIELFWVTQRADGSVFIGCGLAQLVHVAEDGNLGFGGQLVKRRQGGFYSEGTGIIRVIDDGCVVDTGQDIHAAADWREILEHGHHAFNVKSKLQRHRRRAAGNTELMYADNGDDE